MTLVDEKIVTMIKEKLLVPPIAPLLYGSRFHPLSSSIKEEVLVRIIRSPPYLTLYLETKKEETIKKYIRRVVKIASLRKDKSKEEYVHKSKNLQAKNTIRRVIIKELSKNSIKST